MRRDDPPRPTPRADERVLRDILESIPDPDFEPAIFDDDRALPISLPPGTFKTMGRRRRPRGARR